MREGGVRFVRERRNGGPAHAGAPRGVRQPYHRRRSGGKEGGTKPKPEITGLRDAERAKLGEAALVQHAFLCFFFTSSLEGSDSGCGRGGVLRTCFL